MVSLPLMHTVDEEEEAEQQSLPPSVPCLRVLYRGLILSNVRVRRTLGHRPIWMIRAHIINRRR